MEQQGRHSPPTNILPSGAKTISLPSGECLETFHLTQSTGEAPPMLDETTAKRRQFLTAHGGPESPRTHVLPKGEKPIRLPSEECEEKFHLSEPPLPLLSDH
mmetsp:Transcript_13426/g.25533  ORF Transcript_13426/g.25533 Transcript_13426/m.25533 type:complete len:102 (+) Transcript_13426:955-1260(+)